MGSHSGGIYPLNDMDARTKRHSEPVAQEQNQRKTNNKTNGLCMNIKLCKTDSNFWAEFKGGMIEGKRGDN